jgi:hypothetical protein
MNVWFENKERTASKKRVRVIASTFKAQKKYGTKVVKRNKPWYGIAS